MQQPTGCCMFFHIYFSIYVKFLQKTHGFLFKYTYFAIKRINIQL